MKYLVTIASGNLDSASCFSTYDDAILYINNCINAANTRIKDFGSYAPDSFKMLLMDGRDFNIRIERQLDADVRYDLKTVKNGEVVETRRFTKREIAVAYVHRVMRLSGYVIECSNDNEGYWSVRNKGQDTRIEMGLCLAVMGGEQNSDYDLLGIKAGATEAEIKKAYRQKAKENHPDRGGDPAKFEKIQKAYERILKNKTPKSRSVKKYYDSRDMVSFFENYGASEYAKKSQAQSRPRMDIRDELELAKTQANNTASSGAVLLVSGILLPIFIVGSGQFYALVLLLAAILVGWGVFKLVCGLYYQAKIEKILRKLKR